MKYSVELMAEGNGTIVKDLTLAEAIDEIINIATHLTPDDEKGDQYNIWDEDRNIIYTFTVGMFREWQSDNTPQYYHHNGKNGGK